MKYILYLLLIFPLFWSCVSTHKVEPTCSNHISSANVTRDGSTLEKAIIIMENHENEGIAAEYKWIRANYPNSSVTMQSVSMNKKHRPYDTLTILTEDGKKINIYFDISHFFGHN